MKGCIIAGVILVLVLIGVIFNALYIQNTTTVLLHSVDNLPPVPSPVTTPFQIAAIQAMLRNHAPVLGITVPYSAIDRVSEALINLEACARVQDCLQYTETLALLRDLVKELSRTEKVTLENIL